MGDVAAKTYRVKIALPDDTPLKPGMSVEANIVTREKPNALLVPADALQGNAVFVVEGTRVRKRDVTVGIRGTRDCRSRFRSCRGRAGSLAGLDRTQGRRSRAHHAHESYPRHRVDSCAQPRAADWFCGCRRCDRCRLFDHDGGADAGLAGRFHQAAHQYAAAYHGDPTSGASRRRSRPSNCLRAAEIHGLTPEARRPGIKNPLATMAALEVLAARRHRAIGESAGDHPLRQSRRIDDGDGYRSAARGERVGAAKADARCHAHRALSRHQRNRPRRPAVGKDRRPHRRQHHAADQPGRPHHAPRWSASSTPASASRTKARPTC